MNSVLEQLWLTFTQISIVNLNYIFSRQVYDKEQTTFTLLNIQNKFTDGGISWQRGAVDILCMADCFINHAINHAAKVLYQNSSSVN